MRVAGELLLDSDLIVNQFPGDRVVIVVDHLQGVECALFITGEENPSSGALTDCPTETIGHSLNLDSWLHWPRYFNYMMGKVFWLCAEKKTSFEKKFKIT